MSLVVHITPQLPPAIDGVGDYCTNLWQHWPESDSDRDWKFLVARGAEETRRALPGIDVREFALNADSLTGALNEAAPDVVILHYVGYAYQPKGIPVWLPGALDRWKKAGSERRLVTMFHEMYAWSSPLRSPFWVSPFARRIIRDLVGLSDAWVTNCDRYLNQLISRFNARADAGRMLPIGSNIPLAADAAPLTRNPLSLRIVVFGLARTRLWALQRHWQLLKALRERGLIHSITLLGKSGETSDERDWQRLADRIGNVTWRRRFDLTQGEISRELAEQDLGLLANEPDILTKSGVFAALATHGVVPILAASSHAALPSFTANAVLLNDETAGCIASLLAALRDPIRLQRTREQLVKTTAEHLAWPRITQRWHEVLHRVASTRPAKPAAINIPILTNA
jgi:hypothetical protein